MHAIGQRTQLARMIKITGWSLLIGAAALIAALTLFYAPTASDSPAPPITWGTSSGKVIAGTASIVDEMTQLALNPQGTGVVTLAMEPVAARNYPFVHIALEQASSELNVILSWNAPHSKGASRLYRLENKALASQWIATTELRGWSGDIGTLSLVIMGQPGETVLIRDFSLHPASPWRQLQAIYSDFTAYTSWNRAAMNTHTGVINVSSFYPVPLGAALFLLSTLAYGALVVLSRGKLRFRLVNVALIFLANWLILDAVWQNRLWQQLADTYHTYAHVESRQRRSVGPDAPLFRFASQVKSHLAEDSRVIVASNDRYNGMRVAYYLYPFNVYWSVHDPQVPFDEFLHAGDYIALVKPSAFRFKGGRGILVAPERADLPVELVFSNGNGTLVRLK
jgi:hypothetical protein